MAAETETDGVISILLMGFTGGAREALHDFLKSPRWHLREASTYTQALSLLDARPCGVFICDSGSENAIWRSVLAELEHRPHPPNLIVASRLADERLWAEVLNLGGYDVLAQPFERTEVQRVAAMAWMSWQRQAGVRQRTQVPKNGQQHLK